jgi:hypothetical protein
MITSSGFPPCPGWYTRCKLDCVPSSNLQSFFLMTGLQWSELCVALCQFEVQHHWKAIERVKWRQSAGNRRNPTTFKGLFRPDAAGSCCLRVFSLPLTSTWVETSTFCLVCKPERKKGGMGGDHLSPTANRLSSVKVASQWKVKILDIGR